MMLLLSHISAIDYWRINGIRPVLTSSQQRARKAPDTPPDKATYVLAKIPELALPLHVTVSSQSARQKTRMFQTRVTTVTLPTGSVIDVGAGLLVSSPELCFVQMAKILSLEKLIALGLELCGTYALPVAIRNSDQGGNQPDYVTKTQYNRKPLTTIRKLTSCVMRFTEMDGRKKALAALRYITDGSASPMETNLVMLLTLPYRLGGYNLAMPKLNYRIDLVKSARQNANRSFHVCDMFWEGTNVAAEYDSSEFHKGAKRKTDDSRRRNTLASLGIISIEVDSSSIYSLTAFDKTARLIAQNLGKRLRDNENPTFTRARLRLREQLGITSPDDSY